MNLYTFGNLTIDDIVYHENQQLFLDCSGGDALFSALGAWIWQKPVNMVVRIGRDYQRQNIQTLQEAGVNCHLKEINGPDIHTWALYEANGGRQFLSHLLSASYEDMSIQAAEIPFECLGENAYHIAPLPVKIQNGILKRLKQKNCLVSLDSFYHHLLEPQAPETLCDMLKELDFYLPSQKEAALLYGSDDPEAAAIYFASLGCPVVVIKLGEEGALVYETKSGNLQHVPIFKTNAIDPTGAGDSFCGGFLAGYLKVSDPFLATCHAAVSASYIVERVGAAAVLQADYTDINERFEEIKQKIRILYRD